MSETTKRCKKHPRYGATVPPKVACERCWQLYFGISDTCINCGCQQNECEDGYGDD